MNVTKGFGDNFSFSPLFCKTSSNYIEQSLRICRETYLYNEKSRNREKTEASEDI